MSEAYTDITMILDKSSSMAASVESTLAGFNRFLADQKDAPGRATISLIQFSDEARTDYEGIDINDVSELSEETYIPSGMTALNDAVAMGIQRARERHQAMAEADRPHQVIIAIFTDGEENASKEFRGQAGLSNLKTMIEQYQANDGWKFVFLGQGLDAQKAASAYAIPQSMAVAYNSSKEGISKGYGALSRGIVGTRMQSQSLMDSGADPSAAVLSIDMGTDASDESSKGVQVGSVTSDPSST